jgi:mannose-6-phosphate isomerase
MQPGTTHEAMTEAIHTNTLEKLLIFEPVQTGDVIYMAAGTVHALGKGALVYEIQQSSDTTYRLYDWGRLGLDGRPRELHIDKGIAISNLTPPPNILHRADEESPQAMLIRGPYFTTELYQPKNANVTAATNGRFHALTCIEEQVEVVAQGTHVTLNTGQSALIPASVERYLLSGTGRVLASYQS